MSRTRVVLSLLTACVLTTTILAYGQEITGNISGTVTDPSGAAVAEAKTVVTNVLTGAERSTTTTSAGFFYFTSLPVGDYMLTVEGRGFKKSQTNGIHVNVNDKLGFKIVLQVGAATETITVSSEAIPVLQTESGEVSNLVGNRQMESMPLNGREFTQLVDLVPGVAPDNGRVARGGDTAVSVNGNLSNSNLYLVDGTFDEDNGSNAGLMVTPSVDSVEEFKILRGNYSAEFGEATGAIVNVVTKSGGQQFHGSLFEFVRNDALDAADFFLKAKPELREHDYGFTIGGPAWIPGLYNTDRKKDFFFFSGEFRPTIRGNILTDTVPTARQQLGTLDPNCLVTPAPCTVQPFDSQELLLSNEPNVTGTFDPNALAILKRYPMPNADISNGFNFIASSPVNSKPNHYSIRWDHNMSNKAALMVNYMQTNETQLNRSDGWGDDNFPSVSSDWFLTGKVATIKLTNVISPHTVNDFQFGYSNNTIKWQTSKASDPTLASRVGFTYTELFPATSGSFPTANLNDGFGFLNHTSPFFNRTDNFQYKDDLTHVFGKHSLKVGFFSRFSRKTEPANGGDNEDAGNLTFNTLGDLLQGNIAFYTEEQTLNTQRDRGRDYAAYFQDNFKVRPNLTFDYGLRWQYLGQMFSSDNNISGFYPSRYDPTQCPVTAFSNGLVDPTQCNTLNGIVTPKSPGVNRSLKQPYYNDWEPRLGFSWDPWSHNKFLVRGGMGIYHGRDAFSQNSAAGRQPPFDYIPQLNNITFSQLAPGQLSPFSFTSPQPPVNLQVLDQHYRNPTSYQYSFGVQYEFLHDTMLEVNYVGNHQIHVGRNINVNQVLPQFQTGVADGSIDPNTVRPFLGYGIINVNQREGYTRYNSLQAFLRRQMKHGLELQAAYTYSRNISDTINQDSEGRFRPVQDAYHPELEKSVADQDIPHSLVVSYSWEIPAFAHSASWRKAVLGGWQVNGISVFRSGQPLNPCLGGDNAGLGDGGICERPDIVGNPVLDKSKRTLSQYFNTAAFVAPQPGVFGTGWRDPIRGPGINNWDLSFFKNTDIPWFGKKWKGWAAESATIQFRAEFFNVWNHTQLSGVNTTFNIAAPGQPAANSDFGAVVSALAPREIQFGLRLEF